MHVWPWAYIHNLSRALKTQHGRHTAARLSNFYPRMCGQLMEKAIKMCASLHQVMEKS